MDKKSTDRLCFLLPAGILIFSLVFSVAGAAPTAEVLKIHGLKCEYTENPLGLDIQNPQLSWQMESPVRGLFQKSYQIIVTDSEEKAAANEGSLWDSGIRESSVSTGVRYEGPALESRKRYYWRVRVWNSRNTVSPWSETAWFETGLLNQDDWVSDWIGFPAGRPGRVLYFKGIFTAEKEVRFARAYISGLGFYEMNLNGDRVGDHMLDPALSDYSKRIYYSTYDLLPYLKSQNVLVVAVGPGWYGVPKLRLQIEIRYADGTRQVITTSSFRSVTVGPIIKSSIYDGELYDAREENEDLYAFSLPSGFINKRWGYAAVTDPPGGKMTSQDLEPIRVIETLVPQDIREPSPGVYVIDAGRNLAGWASLKVKGSRGETITLKYAESLYANGMVNQENLRSAEAKDTYILKGDTAGESWEPCFTYHGFRYVQVEGFPYPPRAGDIRIRVVRSDVKPAGKFRCSNELLNRIHGMVVATEASNLYSVPTDCPQRDERMGWLNDLTVRIDQALYNFDLSRFYPKFIRDVEDTQAPDGTITCTAPYRYGARPADPVCASYLLLALKSHEFYGNMEIIRRHYPGLKAWVDYLNSRTVDGIVNYSYYGDWCPPVEFGLDGSSPVSRLTPGEFMSTGYLYYCCRMISRMADLLGIGEDRLFYSRLAERTALAMNNKYWDEKSGGYGSNNQACNSFALFLGIADKEKAGRVAENLARDVIAHDNHLTTGNLCTKYLMEMLTEYGHPETAYKLVTQVTYPSWGYMLENGATTLWERWEHATGGAMNSHNHPMMGSVDSWFYKYVLGIQSDGEGPGFGKFCIRPVIFDDLEYAEGELETVKGTIATSWRKVKGTVELQVTVPGNSQATVYIPSRKPESIREGGRSIAGIQDIRKLSVIDGYVVVQVGSGTYHFRSAF